MFQNFYEMMVDGQILAVNLMKKGDKLVVCVLPRSERTKDDAQNHFTPLNLEGTPAELDAGFIAAISNPVRRVSGMLKNMADFEEKAEKAAAESKALKEKAEKINKMIKEAEALEKDKPKDALNAYNKALELDKYNQKIISKVAALQERTMQGNLFAEETSGVSGAKAIDQEVKADQAVKISVVVPEPKTAIENNPGIEPASAMDMFEQAVRANETEASEKSSESIAATSAGPALAGMSPEILAQFQQFMAFQQQQGNKSIIKMK